MIHMIPKFIVIHHSLTRDSGSVSFQAIRKWHMGLIGQPDKTKPNYNYYAKHPMKDNGYHFGLEDVNGRDEILIGRMMNEQGAHVRLHNLNTLGVCWVGNYDLSEVPPGMWELGIRFIASLCDIFKIGSSEVYGHREFDNSKTCPGKKFNMIGLRAQLSQRLIEFS